MKYLKNTLCLLLAAVMIFTAVPLQTASLFTTSLFTTSAEAKQAGTEIIYGNQAGTRQQAEADALNYTETQVSEDYYKSNLNKFPWQHTHTLSMVDSEGLRRLLESTDPADTYIALDGNADRASIKRKCETIVISRNKVLDLNGYEITMRDDSNLSLDEESQAQDYSWHHSTFIRITGGATLTIIDSSRWRPDKHGQFGVGTGAIRITGRMIYPFENDINHYTTRDLFLVENGNLVVYGGTFQAGRQKGQAKKKFTWEKLKATIGHAVGLAVNVMEYATGIDAASAALQDVNDAFKNTPFSETSSKDDGRDDPISSAVQRTGADAKDESQVKTNTEAKRDLSVSEKMAENGKTGSNTADASQAAKADDKNSKLAAARKEVAKSAVNQSGIEGIVGGVFQVIDDIADMIGTDYKSRVTETVFGTAVRVQNNGTFVAYGGTFIGYGSTANVRDAVVEIHKSTTFDSKRGNYKGGQAYIYGGTFEGRAGANIFNFVQASVIQKRWQMLRDDYGNTSYTIKSLPESETNGLQVITYEGDPKTEQEIENAPPVNTCNVVVRGGTFRNYYEYKMLSIKDPNDADGQHFTWFFGTPGGLGLGIQSFGEDMIKDGRIQIIDTYGDGNLVLMDEHTGDKNDVCHYRLFCSDLDLRYKTYIDVRPNTAQTNATHTLSLRSKYMESGTVTKDNEAKPFTSSGENDRTAGFSRTERAFMYPLDSKNTPNYYVVPDLGATDPFGTDLDTSNVWYYAEPKDSKGNKIPNLLLGETWGEGISKDGRSACYANQRMHSDKDWEKVASRAKSGSFKCYTKTNNYKTNVKWYTYKVYRVDPLTRDNISESWQWGVDQPLCTVSYGSSDDSLRCKMTLAKLEEYMKANCGFAGYRPGEIYRVIFTVEETLKFDYLNSSWAVSQLPVATATSSILFQCYNSKEVVNLGGAYGTVDFTPLQWTTEPHVESWASVQLRNGKAGLADYDGNKIFDVYYQWYAIDARGRHNMIAGTDNIYKGDRENKWKHDISMWNVGTDGKTYRNTVDPRDPNAKNYVNGLPRDKNQWTDQMLHAYTDEITDHNKLKSDVSQDLDHTNNRPYETNFDMCYIPKEYAGCKIYVKAIVVNTYWQNQYDHVQVFTSRPVQLEEPEPDPIVFYTQITPGTENGMISKADPAKVSVSTLTGLAKDETITSVTYIAHGYAKTFKGLKATKASDLPTATFPDDFLPAGSELSPRQMTLNAFVTISSGRGTGAFEKSVGFYTAKKQTFSYDQKVKSLSFSKDDGKVIKVSLDDKDNTQALRKALYAGYSPGMATYGATTFTQNVTYTTENAFIASLKKDGSLSLGGELGKTKLTLLSPDGKRPWVTVHVVQEVSDVYVSGLDEPVAGQKFDTDVEIPENAPYWVRNVTWTDVSTGELMPVNATAENYRYYTAHVYLLPKDNVEAGMDVNVHGSVTLKDGKTLTDVDGTWADFDDMENRFTATSFHFEYTFAVLPEGIEKTTVDRIFFTFPDKIPEGTDVSEWRKQASFTTDVKDIDNTEAGVTLGSIDMMYDYCGIRTARNLGYGESGYGIPNAVSVFIKGVQRGFAVDFKISPSSPITFGSNVQVYVNGRLADKNELIVNADTVILVSNHAFTITDGTPLQPNTEEFRIKDFNLYVGKEIRLSDLLETDSENIRLFSSTSPDGYFEYDDDTNTLKALKAYTAGGGITVPLYAAFNTDGNGKGGEVRSFSVLKRIYATEADANRYPPSNKNKQTMALVTLQNEDGSEIRTPQVYSYGQGLEEYLNIPVPEGRLLMKVADEYGIDYPVTANGVKVTGEIAGKHLTATVSDGGVIPRPGVTEVYADGPAQAPAMLYSLDGEHWTANDHFTGLTADTEYTLYYKQTAVGAVNSVPFKTATQFYGIYVGKTPVTNEMMGDARIDGWYFDRTKDWLYLYDLDLFTTGSETHVYKAYGDLSVSHAAIRAEGDLNLALVGNSRVALAYDGTAYDNDAIVCGGRLFILQNNPGNLTIDVDESQGNAYDSAFVCGGDAIFGGGGKIVINNYGRGVKFTDKNSTFIYWNGDIDFNPYVSEYPAGYFTELGSFLDKGAKYSFADADHAYSFKIGRNEENATRDEWAATFGNSRGSHIIPTHDSNGGRNLETPLGLVEGNCLTEYVTYHKVCSCGALMPGTFTVRSRGQHTYWDTDAKAPTCTAGGYNAYRYCSVCGDNNVVLLPATGHSFVKVSMVEPTCTSNGVPGFTQCENCGLSPDKPLEQQIEDRIYYRARGHELTFVSGTSKCLAAGSADHYVCTVCGKAFRDEEGLIEMSAGEVKLSAAGHTFGDWTVTKYPTATADGETKRTCDVCGTVETAAIPKGSKLTDPSGAHYTPGDVDGNGKVETKDARLALRCSIGLEKYAEGSREFLACDVNKNNKVGTDDARFILRRSIGLKDPEISW